MIDVKTDFDRYTPGKWRRKAVTFLGSRPGIPTFSIRRVIRYPDTKNLVEAAVTSGSFPLPQPVFNSLEEKRSGVVDSLLDWNMQSPTSKFSLSVKDRTYKLSVVDAEAKDSYFLSSPQWEDVRLALVALTGGAVNLKSPAILAVYNPFTSVAPFNTPLLDHFETVNNEAIASLKTAIEKMNMGENPHFMRGKVLSSYYTCIAELEKLSNVMRVLDTPATDDFENEGLEN